MDSLWTRQQNRLLPWALPSFLVSPADVTTHINEAIILSAKPRYAALIVDGTKTVELRRKAPLRWNLPVLLYASSPMQCLLATCRIWKIQKDRPTVFRDQVLALCGLTEAEFSAYFEGCEVGAALYLRDVVPLSKPPTLAEMRARVPTFRPPQNFGYIELDEGYRLLGDRNPLDWVAR